MSRRLIGGALAAATLAAALLAAGSSPAAAHTRLLETIPDNRTIAETPPERLTLVFAEAVDPRTVQLDVIAADGGLVPGAALLTPGGADQAVIEFSLPALTDGVYGLSWITVGPDGHRVAGEVVVGVGAVDGASVTDARFSETPPLERILSVAAGIARYLWYFGLAAVAGSMLVLAWGLRPGPGTPAKEILGRRARRALVRGALVLHIGILVRAAATITLVTRGYRSGSLSEDLQLALVDGMGLTLLLAAVAAGALVVWSPRLSRARSGWTFLQAGLGVMALVAVGSATSHTAVLSEDPFGIWVSTLHLTAASLWLGPLLVVGWATASGGWRARPAAERAATLREVFGRFGPVAVGAFAVLVATGARSTWLLAGSELLSGSSGYTTALILKLALLALVILPLGAYHDRRLGWLARSGNHYIIRDREQLTLRSR